MSFITLNIKTRIGFAARLPQAGRSVYKMTSAHKFSKMGFFLICILNTYFLQIKSILVNFVNFVTVSDTFISKLTFKVKY
jgi:hypothetical protein